MPKKNIALICCYAAAMVSLVPCAPGKNLSGPSLDISGTATVGVLNSGSASIGTLGVTGLAALQGGVTISGTADIFGNFMLLGSWVSNPETFGVSFVYDDGANGNNACFTQTVSRPAANWNWQRITATGSTSVVMQLDASNRLILTGTGENSSFIILDPNSAISVNGNDLLTQSSADTRYFPASAGLVGLNGNIGLGIATPTSRLDISGNVAIGSYAGTVAAPVNGMIVSGSVGIGTSTPMEALDVNGNINLPITSATAGQIKQAGQLLLHTTGSSNFFAGKSAGNLKIQNSAGGSGVGYSNTGIGAFSLNGIITGRCNTAFGESSAMRLTTGDDNVAIGVGALNSLSKECENVAIGVGALSSAFGVYNTVAIGNSAGRWIYGGGTNNIYIGYQAGTNGTSGLYNAIAIGANSQVKKSNSFVLGGTGTYAVNVGIGTVAPNAALDVIGDIISSGTGNLMPNQTIACGSASVLTLGIADQRYIQNGTAYSGTISVSQVSGLSSVAINGNYDSLTGAPVIPTNVSQLANDIGYITPSGTAAFAQTSATAAALTGNIQASQVVGLASVATDGTLDYSKVTNAPSVPTNISAFINDAGYVASGGTISNLALSGTTDISGAARITGGAVVTGTTVQLEEGMSKVVAIAGNRLLVPEQGDISMGKYINGTQPQ